MLGHAPIAPTPRTPQSRPTLPARGSPPRSALSDPSNRVLARRRQHTPPPRRARSGRTHCSAPKWRPIALLCRSPIPRNNLASTSGTRRSPQRPTRPPRRIARSTQASGCGRGRQGTLGLEPNRDPRTPAPIGQRRNRGGSTAPGWIVPPSITTKGEGEGGQPVNRRRA